MAENVNLKKLEKKVWIFNFQDGLFDILFGCFFLGIAFNYYFLEISQPPFNILIMMAIDLAALLMFRINKKYITVSRTGLVKFGPKRKANLKKLGIVSTILVGYTIIMVILTITHPFNIRVEGLLAAVILSLFIIIPFTVFALFLDFNRGYLIAAMGGFSLFFTILFHEYGANINIVGAITFGIAGSLIVAWGFIFFIRFVRKYPLPNKEEMV